MKNDNLCKRHPPLNNSVSRPFSGDGNHHNDDDDNNAYDNDNRDKAAFRINRGNNIELKMLG